MKFTEIEQIKNFEYSVACTDMTLSESKKILVSIGTYRPAVKTHDLINLTQKTERHLEFEPLRVECLDREGEKLCILREDSVLEFHAKYGLHEKVKLPRKSYDLKFNKFNSEILSGGFKNIYRFNLEHGKFMKPYLTTILPSSISLNTVHGLIGLCGQNKIQFIDQRISKVISSTEHPFEFTSMDFSENGINFSVSSEEGNVLFFDLRSKINLNQIKHEGPIKKVKVRRKTTISCDRTSLQISNNDQNTILNMNVPINTFEICDGVLFVGCDSPKLKTFYSSGFGEIPEWCKIVKVEE